MEKDIEIIKSLIEDLKMEEKLIGYNAEVKIKALENLINRCKELEKYDIRNIKLEDDKILKSPSFTKKEIDLMNLGIALSSSFDKMFDDESED